MKKCSFCNKKAIYSDGIYNYCRDHFIKNFEEKALDTIETFNLIDPGDIIGVGISGGKDSISLMYFLHKYSKELDIKVIGIHIDEGIRNYRDILTEYLLKIAKKFKWDIRVYRFREYFNIDLDYAVKISNKFKSCTICGVWRRWVLQKAAQDIGVTKIATGHNINDEAQTIMLNLFEGNLKDLFKGGPYVGITKQYFIPRIKPFYFLTEKETTIYAILNNINPPWTECPYVQNQSRDFIRKQLYTIESKYPRFHKGIISWYINNIVLKKGKRKIYSNINLSKCKLCDYPTSRDICRACEIKNILLKEAKLTN